MMKRLLCCTVILAAFVLAHCGDDSTSADDGCTSNVDCAQLGPNFVCDVVNKSCICVPECTNNCCGSDGCGGTCTDNCGAGLACNADTCQCELVDTGCQDDSECKYLGANGACVDGDCTCNPTCEGCCGADGCGGVCPDNCTGDATCNETTCQCEVEAKCQIDGDCSALGTNGKCIDGDCVCTPTCGAYQCCDDNGCNGECPNNCAQGSTCNENCECEAACDNDGDGDSCETDCDDNNAAINHAQIEDCTNGVDDNCDGLADCADASCDQIHPDCMQCQASTGVGDVCDLDSNICSCDNVCGELAVGSSPNFSEHYCYAECSETIACENNNQICIGFSEGTAGCLALGTFKFAWKTKILAEGTQLSMGNVTQIPNIEDATLDGQSVNLSLMAGIGYTDEDGQEYVVLLAIAVDQATSAQWTLQLLVPKENWAVGQLLTGLVEEDQDPNNPYSDFYGQLGYATLDSSYLEGFSVSGILNLTKVTEPGDVGTWINPKLSEGDLELVLVNYKAKYASQETP